MKIYDISQKVFCCQTYPGDPKPEMLDLMRICRGDLYNLSAFSMCVHNGTHIDAPFHFLNDGKTVDKIPTENFVGMAYVAQCEGQVTKEIAQDILNNANCLGNGCHKRILIKGNAVVTPDAACIFAKSDILLLGNESQSVGPENAPSEVHRILLSKDVVLLEGIRLKDVSEGTYLLCALPLNLENCDGAPCRAVLIELD